MISRAEAKEMMRKYEEWQNYVAGRVMDYFAAHPDEAFFQEGLASALAFPEMTYCGPLYVRTDYVLGKVLERLARSEKLAYDSQDGKWCLKELFKAREEQWATRGRREREVLSVESAKLRPQILELLTKTPDKLYHNGDICAALNIQNTSYCLSALEMLVNNEQIEAVSIATTSYYGVPQVKENNADSPAVKPEGRDTADASRA